MKIFFTFLSILGICLYISCSMLHKKTPESYMESGKKYYDKKDYVKAYKNYSRAIKLNPFYYPAYWNRAMVDVKIDSLEKAIDDIGMYISSGEASQNSNKDSLSKAYFQRAEIMFKQGYKTDACDDWNACCQLNQKNAPSACEQYRLHCK